MLTAVTVGASRINRLGVFAQVNFAPGEEVLAIDDSHVIDHAHPVPQGEEHHCDYLEHGKTVWMQPPERYINHSCDPNVFVQTRGGIRRVLALKPIAPGDEIVYDYCINSSGDVVWECNCGASRCRRSIHSDFFYLPRELQLEYLPLLDDWFLRERADEIDKLKATLPGELI